MAVVKTCSACNGSGLLEPVPPFIMITGSNNLWGMDATGRVWEYIRINSTNGWRKVTTTVHPEGGSDVED